MWIPARYKDSTKNKIITEGEWFSLSEDINRLDNFQGKLVAIPVIGFFIIGALYLVFTLVRIFLINPLLPLWNSSDNQTRATLVLGTLLTAISLITIEVVKKILNHSSNNKEK